MGRIADALALLTQISGMQTTKTASVMQPLPFRGESSAAAKRFLSTFTMWAMAQGTDMNVVNEHGVAVRRRDAEWIRSALSFLQGDAGTWAGPSMDQFADGGPPFGGLWANFCRDFKARFESANDEADAKEKLRVLEQGSLTVPEFTARFKELMTRTRYSMHDLRDRYYDRLNERVKDMLLNVMKPQNTLDELIETATEVDARIRRRRTERDAKRGQTGVSTGTFAARTQQPTPTFTAPSDPNAMDVGAVARTREGYKRFMQGRCWGCGSKAHTKRDGNHERDMCSHCNRVGHRGGVCADKFMGRPPSQKAAATEDGTSAFDFPLLEDTSSEAPEIEWSEGSPDGSVIAEIAASSSDTRVLPPDALAQLLDQQKALVDQQKALADQIAALRVQDF
jgi:hypothetical protein